jgi:pyruvate dehydrogenase kinase 2/3/4
MAQTITHHKAKELIGELPPIRIWISDGCEDVSFKIDDEGGGMLISDLPKVWSYMYPSFTVLNNPPGPEYPFKEYCIPASFSLPFTRTLSRYFGGDLEIVPAGMSALF